MRDFLFITSFLGLEVESTSASSKPRTEIKNLRIAAETYSKIGGETRHGIRFNPESTRGMVAWAAGRIFNWQRPGGNRNVPYLNDWDDKRKLNLNSFENDWNENYRFAAVRNWIYLTKPPPRRWFWLFLSLGRPLCLRRCPASGGFPAWRGRGHNRAWIG